MALIEFDYDNGTATEWERLGSCNGCAKCCTGKMIFRRETENTSPEEYLILGGGKGTSGSGVWQTATNGKIMVCRQLIEWKDTGERCSNLTDDLKCTNYDTRYGACHLYPMSPRDTALFTECSYTFRKVQEWSLVNDKTTGS